MQIRSFAAGILAGLILGGVAWAGHGATEGVTYAVDSDGRGDRSTRNLTVAQGWFAERRDALDAYLDGGLLKRGPTTVQLLERTCASRVLDSYSR